MGRYKLSTNHSASNYGQPVVVDTRTGIAYGLADILPDGRFGLEVLRELDREGRYSHLYRLLDKLTGP